MWVLYNVLVYLYRRDSRNIDGRGGGGGFGGYHRNNTSTEDIHRRSSVSVHVLTCVHVLYSIMTCGCNVQWYICIVLD